MDKKSEATTPQASGTNDSPKTDDYVKVEVLVVEDNFFSQVAVINLLEQYGFESHSATDGQEAFEKV